MANIFSYKGFTVGDVAYVYYDATLPCEKGKISSILSYGEDTNFDFRFEDGRHCAIPYEQVFKSESICRAYAEMLSEQCTQGYKSCIIDMDSLIAFCVKAMSDNPEAVRAVKERYAEIKVNSEHMSYTLAKEQSKSNIDSAFER